MVLEMKIIKEELRFEENLKKRLEFICEFSKVTPTFVNGSIRKIEKTNISYIEPHRVIVKDTTFLVFNYSNDVYMSNLAKKIKLSELEDYINSIKQAKFDISENRDIIPAVNYLCLLARSVYMFSLFCKKICIKINRFKRCQG